MDVGEIYSNVMGYVQPAMDWIENFINTVVADGFQAILQAVLAYDQWKWLIDIFSGIAV
ncbi:MAG: hypothetical protein LBQ33_04120 [Oscillospiraceae bacterium]|jgi:hypothetical protein|nr:hypothetical protein [Oscillospiraceae bacterium]